MRPDNYVTGMPYNFDALPLLILPDLWNEEKNVPWRGAWLVLLYTLSVFVFGIFAFIPIGLYCVLGRSNMSSIAALWFGFHFIGGILMGFAVWHDFVRARRKLRAQENAD